MSHYSLEQIAYLEASLILLQRLHNAEQEPFYSNSDIHAEFGLK